MKRILITTESLTMGGVETSLLTLIKTLKEYDVEIDLYVLQKGDLYNKFREIVNVYDIPIKIPKNRIIYRITKNLYFNKLKKQRSFSGIFIYMLNN